MESAPLSGEMSGVCSEVLTITGVTLMAEAWRVPVV
jgi:hypothetical protein